MSNVVSLADRSETWKLTYTLDKFRAYVSSRGRIKMMMGDEIITMDTIESVDFMGRVSKSFEDEFNVLFQEV
jgi:hypothetical protein